MRGSRELNLGEDVLNILLVEDYPPDAELLILQLKRDGILCHWIRVDTRRDFVAALEAFDPDIVLSDYTVPGFGGLEALKIVRTHYPSIPLIIVTGSISEEAAVLCMKEGASDYVIKENLSRLATAVTKALEKKHSDAARAKVEHDLKLKNAAVESATDPIILADLTGGIFYANAAFVELWGYQHKEEVIGKSLQPFFESESAVDDVMASILRKGMWRGELKGRRADGELFFLTGSLGIVRDMNDDPLAMMGGFVDISARRNLEEQLRQSQKMEALGTLAGGIAHDFNNLLAAIMGYTDMAMEDLAMDSPLFMNLEQVYLAATRAAALVQQILTFSRSAETERQAMHLQPVLKETIKLLRGSVPPNVHIVKDISTECGRVNIDITQFHQTVMNLCVNAVHAMRENGGTLDISLNPCKIENDRSPPLTALSTGDYVRLSVSDTGHGMDGKVKARIFDPFFTTKPNGEGTGLGLSTVHGIVKSSGGAVHVDSLLGEGTRFDVYFPVVAFTEEAVTSDRPQPVFPMSTTARRILLVDDEYSIAQVYKYALERLGVEVEAHVTPDKAVSAFKADPDRYNLVLTDYVMPEKSGIDVALKIREISSDVPILISTGNSERLDSAMLGRVGISEVIPKPVGNNVLRQIVQRYL